jgi:drug/metabolite transporter (DMT)-like permease
MSLRHWLIIFLLGMGWGSSFFFNEILLRELGPITVGLGRVGMGAIGCWIWLVMRKKPWAVPRAAMVQLAVFGIFQYAIPLTIYPVMQQFITSSAAGIVNAITPIMVVLVSHVWPAGERATPLKSVGVVLGFLGIVVMTVPSFQGQGASNPWALIATMVAPLCYGVALNLLRRMDAMDRTVLTAWSLTFGALMIAPLALWVEGPPVITEAATLGALVIIGFVLTSASFIVLFWLIPIVGGTTASTITFIAPISAVLLGVLVLNEVIGVFHLAGMALIFSGLLFIDGRLMWIFQRRAGDFAANVQPKG